MLLISRNDHCAERAIPSLPAGYHKYLVTLKLVTSLMVRRARPLRRLQLDTSFAVRGLNSPLACRISNRRHRQTLTTYRRYLRVGSVCNVGGQLVVPLKFRTLYDVVLKRVDHTNYVDLLTSDEIALYCEGYTNTKRCHDLFHEL